MALDRPTKDRDYVTRRDPYRITLTDREQYLVRSIRGSEVLARWDATDATFRRVQATTIDARNAPIPAEAVAAVAVPVKTKRRKAKSQWCPFAQCQFDTAPPKQTVGTAILAILTQHGPKTTAQLREFLPHLPPQTVRTTVVNLAGRQQVGRSTVMVGNRQLTAWTVGAVSYEERKPSGRPFKDEAWTPTPWVHPIRGRLLGLPIAKAPTMEPVADYSDPRRKAA